MSSHSASDEPPPTGFVCGWAPAGAHAADVRAAGELDLATVPELARVLAEALEHARLIVINLRELSFADSSGLHLLLDAARRSRERGSRLVLLGVSPALENLLALTGIRPLVDMLPGTPQRGDREPGAPSAHPGHDPLRNPVNSRVVLARVMDIADRAVWVHGPDGAIRDVWAPADDRPRVAAGAQVEVYLGHQDEVNGWWHQSLGLAINQRHLATLETESVTATPLACQGACALVWQAPAATHVLDHHEGCLTCAGALVPV